MAPMQTRRDCQSLNKYFTYGNLTTSDCNSFDTEFSNLYNVVAASFVLHLVTIRDRSSVWSFFVWSTKLSTVIMRGL